MTLPYSKVHSFSADSGVDNCLELPVPPRGTLMRLIVKQVDGALDGFEFDLYDRNDACPGVSQESCNPGDEAFDPDMHKIAATVTVAPAAASSEQFQLWTPYDNKDSLCDGLHASKRPRLYMRLAPSGGGTKTFEVGFTVTTDLD